MKHRLSYRINLAALLVSLCSPVFGGEDAKDDLVIRSAPFPVIAANGKSYQCTKSEFGAYKNIDGKKTYHLGVVDYRCEYSTPTLQILCRFSWGPENATPPDNLVDAAAEGEIRWFTADLSDSSSLKMKEEHAEFSSVLSTEADEVAKQYLKNRCLELISNPLPAAAD